MIQGLEKLLFKRMWLTPHHFKLAVQTMLIVLFSGVFDPDAQSVCCGRAAGHRGCAGTGMGAAGGLAGPARGRVQEASQLMGSVVRAHSLGGARLATTLGVLLMSLSISNTWAPRGNAILLPNLFGDPVD